MKPCSSCQAAILHPSNELARPSLGMSSLAGMGCLPLWRPALRAAPLQGPHDSHGEEGHAGQLRATLRRAMPGLSSALL